MRHANSCILAVLLLTAMLAAVGCGSTSASEDTTAAAGGDTTTAPETEDIYKNVPTGDFGGYEFRIFSSTCTWAKYKLDSEGMDGEVLNDAVYTRNQAVEERLNVKLVFTEQDDMYSSQSKIQTLVLAGEDAYDACYLASYKAAPLTVDKLFMNLYDIDEIHFDEPWWNQRSLSYYELDGKLYWANGDASVHYYECMWSVLFNKKLIEDLKLDDPYALIEKNGWTIDVFHSMLQKATRDLDGNGKMEDTDQFGLVTHSGSVFGFLHGMDERAIDVEDGLPVVVKPDERMFDVMESIQKVFGETGVRNVNDGKKDDIFMENRTLFLIETLGIAGQLRGMNTDFGIVPFPKYDAEQEGYHSNISPDNISLQIPSTVKDPSRTGTVVEVMNALSYETVRPAYLEVILGEKYMRDETSKKTVETMLDAAACDLAYVYQWASYHKTFLDGLSGDTAMASAIESKRSSVETAIEQFVEKLQ